jgi:hypothetical protein
MVVSFTAIRTADTIRVVLEALPFHVQFMVLVGLPFILQLILGSWYAAMVSMWKSTWWHVTLSEHGRSSRLTRQQIATTH